MTSTFRHMSGSGRMAFGWPSLGRKSLVETEADVRAALKPELDARSLGPVTTRVAADASGQACDANERRTTMTETSALRAAVIVDDGSADVDVLLADAAREAQRAGRRVCGVLMTYPDGAVSCSGAMVLVDLNTQEAFLVSQPLGRDSKACRADPQGFARASQVLRRAVQEAPDLVVSNRFGGLEAAGGGFCAELLDILALDLPLLTAVATRHLADWQRFTGGTTLLPARADEINAWLADTLSGPSPETDIDTTAVRS